MSVTCQIFLPSVVTFFCIDMNTFRRARAFGFDMGDEAVGGMTGVAKDMESSVDVVNGGGDAVHVGGRA